MPDLSVAELAERAAASFEAGLDHAAVADGEALLARSQDMLTMSPVERITALGPVERLVRASIDAGDRLLDDEYQSIDAEFSPRPTPIKLRRRVQTLTVELHQALEPVYASLTGGAS